jgi:uncharacterized protein (TIGR00251 family)
MRITVKAHPCAKQNKVEPMGENALKVHVTAPPDKGKANRAVLELLADYFNAPISRLRIVKGQGSREKIVDIR